MAVSAPFARSEWDTPKPTSCASVQYGTITTHRCGGARDCRRQMLRRGRDADDIHVYNILYRILCLSVWDARARVSVNVYTSVCVNMYVFVCVPSTTTTTTITAAATITARRACWPIDRHRRTDAPKAPSWRVYIIYTYGVYLHRRRHTCLT